jgi:hypothetical protein
VGETRRENGRAFARLLSLSACTDAESLEHPARGPSRSQSGFSLRCIHRRAASSRWEVMRLPGLSRGFLVSFAEPGAIAPVLIPLDTDAKGFEAITDIRYDYSVLV